MQSYPLKVLGTQHGRNVSVIRLSSGRTILHSMAPFTVDDRSAILDIGPPEWLVEAMLLHDTYAKAGRESFPEASFLAPPDFDKVVGFPTRRLYPAPAEWQGELEVLPLDGIPKLKEHVMIHRPSRTLIVADLVFNFSPDENGWDRFFHRYLAGMKRYPAMSRVFRVCITDRTSFRASISRLMELDFDRIIVGHGHVIERDGKPLLRRALGDAGLY